MADQYQNPINWFPGHMAVTRRMIAENLGAVDLVLELLDARIPASSRNPEIAGLVRDKKRIVILNKADLADPALTARWKKALRADGLFPLEMNCKNGGDKGKKELLNLAEALLSEKRRRERAKGMEKSIRAMVLGIPNVGKSTLINFLAGAKKARAENRPGVTKTKQWVRVSPALELLDMPGVLWPKFEDQAVGENLAVTGAIKDAILDTNRIALVLLERLTDRYPALLAARYRLGEQDIKESGDKLMEIIAKKRGFLLPGGEIDVERCAGVLLDEFRSGVIGRITLEGPENGF